MTYFTHPNPLGSTTMVTDYDGNVVQDNLFEGYLHVPFGKTRAAKRNVPLDKEAARVLAARLEKFGTDVYVFPSKRDAKRPMGMIVNTHHRTVERTKLPWFRLYDLRHTFATRAAQSNMDLPTLAGI